MSTVEERLTQLLIDNYKVDPARLTLDAPLVSLGIDSLGMVELLFTIEDEFKVKLPADTDVLPTLGAAVHCIEQLLLRAPPIAALTPPPPTASAPSPTQPP